MLKKYFNEKDKKVVVEFSLPANRTKDAAEVLLVGEFNNWLKDQENRIPMRREDDVYKVQYTLDMNREYKYKYYVVDTDKWLIDWQADKYVPSPLIGSDCVVITYKFME